MPVSASLPGSWWRLRLVRALFRTRQYQLGIRLLNAQRIRYRIGSATSVGKIRARIHRGKVKIDAMPVPPIVQR